MATTASAPITTSLNFAGDLADGGRFSNFSHDRVDLTLTSRTVSIRDARAMADPPRLDREGLALVSHPVSNARWTDKEWIDTVYVPSCIELVTRQTGAQDAMQLFSPLVRRVDYAGQSNAGAPATFVHIDFPRDFAIQTVREHAIMADIDYPGRYRRAEVYNIWKCFSAPPQDCSLTVSDRRTIAAADHVRGVTLEYGEDGEPWAEIPYCLIAPSAEPAFFHFPSLTAGESLLFLGLDLDPAKPLGCAHSAFIHPDPGPVSEPRASIEVRVIAFFA